MATVKRTNEEWLKLYRQQRDSGMTMKTWCAANSVPLSTMADRVSKLRKAGAIVEQRPPGGRFSPRRIAVSCEAPAPRWVEVAASEPGPDVRDGDIRVEIGKFRVVVPVRFQEAAFLCVCKVLMSLC